MNIFQKTFQFLSKNKLLFFLVNCTFALFIIITRYIFDLQYAFTTTEITAGMVCGIISILLIIGTCILLYLAKQNKVGLITKSLSYALLTYETFDLIWNIKWSLRTKGVLIVCVIIIVIYFLVMTILAIIENIQANKYPDQINLESEDKNDKILLMGSAAISVWHYLYYTIIYAQSIKIYGIYFSDIIILSFILVLLSFIMFYVIKDGAIKRYIGVYAPIGIAVFTVFNVILKENYTIMELLLREATRQSHELLYLIVIIAPLVMTGIMTFKTLDQIYISSDNK